MKTLKLGIIIAVLIIVSLKANSQSISDIFQNNDLNYFQKVEQVEALQDRASKGEIAIDSSLLKRYFRYVTFWDSRMDINGKPDTYLQNIKYYSDNRNQNTTNINWENVGPRFLTSSNAPYIGRIESIEVVIKGSDTIIYAGSNSAGLFKSTDNGLTYTCKTENFFGGVKHLALHPVNKDTMFISTGFSSTGLLGSGRYGTGCYRSYDGGETWQSVLPFEIVEMNHFTDIKFDPINPNTVYAINDERVYVSHDLGENWNEDGSILVNGLSRLEEIEIMPTDNSKIMLGGNALFRRNNSGWENITDSIKSHLPDTAIGFRVGISSYNHEFYFLVYYRISHEGYSIDHNKFFKTSDYGNSFIELSSGSASGKGFVLYFAMSPNGVFYGGGTFMYRNSTPYSNFEPIATGLHADIRDICFPDPSNPNLIYVATDGGIGMTQNGASPWKNLSGDLAVNECYSTSISEQNSELYLVGSHDNGTKRRENDGTWNKVYGGDGGSTLVCTHNAQIMFQRGNYPIQRSDDGGDSWGSITPTVGSMTYDQPMVQSYKNPNNIVVSGYIDNKDWKHCLLKSTNEGESFFQFTPIHSSRRIVALDVDKNNENIVYYADVFYNFNYPYPWPFETKLYKTTNGGGVNAGNWFDISQTINDVSQDLLNEVKIHEIYTHPLHENSLWVCFDGFSDGNKVYSSVNGGDNWINISHNLPNLPVYSIEYDKYNDILFVGTDLGVYFLSNPSSNTDWQLYGKLPTVIVSDLKINNTTGELIVATYGRGVWKADLGCYFKSEPLVLSENNIWSENRTVNQVIEIQPGKTLTINSDSKIYFSPDSKIIVKPGGKLIVDGAKLTNSCGSQWQGIQLIGNPDANQTTANQPVVELINGAIIENALYGIYTGDLSNPGNNGGGIVKANGATFRNCGVGISIEPYRNLIPGTTIEQNNASYITKCNFKTTADYLNLSRVDTTGISSSNVKGVSVLGYSFINVDYAAFTFNKRGTSIQISG